MLKRQPFIRVLYTLARVMRARLAAADDCARRQILLFPRRQCGLARYPHLIAFPRQSLINVLLGLTCLVLASAHAAPQSVGAGNGCGGRESSLPLRGITDEWRYTLTARFRFLLFWISRENVGGARIGLMQDAGGERGLELLIGSDPQRAPMRINRWGYVAEQTTGSSSRLLGVMTAADEQSVEQARAGVTQTRATHLFKAIRGGVDNRVAHSTVMHLPLKDDFTFRDLEALVRILPEKGTTTKRRVLPESAEPGFLFAVKSMLEEGIGVYKRTGRPPGSPRMTRTYVYDASLFELTRTSSRVLDETAVNGRTYRSAIESDFEVRNLATGNIGSFSILYGTSGAVEAMPIRIVYRPRWWFEAELLLQDGPVTQQANAGAIPCKSGSR